MPAPFVKLADPSTYVACDWDLAADAPARTHWVNFFCEHIELLLRLGVEAAIARGESSDAATARASACRTEFLQTFRSYAASPPTGQKITILTLDQWRDQILRRHGFVDCMVDLKSRENQRTLPLIPSVLSQLQATPSALQPQFVIEGIFAGNIFDMGAAATAKQFATSTPDFFNIRKTLAPRPWLIDDFDNLQHRLLHSPAHRKCIFFVDNAGSDFLLGVLPMVQYLAGRGTRVVLAANERPTLNDMTVHDVRAWWPQILHAAPSLAALPIDIVSTGTGEPLIDLASVSDELNTAAADADLVILEGMGRGVESNLRAHLSCDTLNLAMLKDEQVALRHQGKLYDCICRFRSVHE